MGAVIGTGFGLINGYISGDRGDALLVDAVAGGLTGGLAGLTNGLSLAEGIGARAVVSAGIEGYRQLANDAVEGCIKDTGYHGLLFAGAGSIIGDGFAGFVGSALQESFATATHTVVVSSEGVEAAISNTLAGVTAIPVAIEDYMKSHR